MMLSAYTLFHILMCRLCIINAQSISLSSRGLTEFPSTEINVRATEIYVNHNDISSFNNDSAFVDFFRLKILGLQNNPFTKLPNLRPVGNTLQTLYAGETNLAYIDWDLFAALVKLQTASFYGAKLAEFPNVAGPATTLLFLDLRSNQLTSTPCLDKYTVLSNPSLDGNPIVASSEDPCLVIPTNFSADVGELADLTEIIVASEMTTVPVTCPRNDLTISFEDAPVSLCLCKNLWIKALDGQRGSVEMGDKTCGGATTTAEILQQECQNDLATGKSMIPSKEKFFCSFPIAQYVTGIRLMDCAVACLETLGCTGYNFRETTRPMFGDCAIVAPTDSSITDIPDQDSPDWTYWREKE